MIFQAALKLSNWFYLEFAYLKSHRWSHILVAVKII